ncbi:MAG: hypothetical protein ACPHDT_16345, partial [Acidimicrobiales bacterium]
QRARTVLFMTTLRTVATIAAVTMTGQSGETVQTWIDDLIETIRVTPSSTDDPGASRKADQSRVVRNEWGCIDSDAEAFAHVAVGAVIGFGHDET